jgi:hypothetical protein
VITGYTEIGLRSFGVEGEESLGIGSTLDNLRGFGISSALMKELNRQAGFWTNEGEFIQELIIFGHNSMVSCERELGFFYLLPYLFNVISR